jgi:DNA-directed RNA polymerase subunit K/omega
MVKTDDEEYESEYSEDSSDIDSDDDNNSDDEGKIENIKKIKENKLIQKDDNTVNSDDEKLKYDDDNDDNNDDNDDNNNDNDNSDIYEDEFYDNNDEECNNVTKIINKLNIHNDIKKNKTIDYLTGENRISRPILTKYEYVRIIGERTKQLTMGAKPLITNINKLNYKEIAIAELKQNTLPFKIVRPLPNNQFELWDLNELEKEYSIFKI